MGRPPKPFTVLSIEKRSHKTKAELELRKAGEESLSSGVSLKERPEAKNNPIAHKEFLRVSKLLKSIEKNDALYEPVINRYCMIIAECVDLEEQKTYFYNLIHELRKSFKTVCEDIKDTESAALLLMDHSREMTKLANAMFNLDKVLMGKRRMLLDIERESIMTITSVLRSIPKKVIEKDADDPMAQLLNRRNRK